MKNKYTGLTESEVLTNQKLYGKNVIIYEKSNKLLNNMIKILKQPIPILLIMCAIIYLILGKIIYAIIIGGIGIIILMVYIYQNLKTTKLIRLLKKINSDTCKVIRDGNEIIINSDDVTINDIIIVNEGDKVCADAIILESNNLFADESDIIKNNINVPKSYDLLDKDATLKSNYIYKESFIIKGSGIAKVTNIGNKTEYGKINYVSKKETCSKIQKEIDKLYKVLTITAIIMFGIVVVISTLNNDVLIGIFSGITMILASIPMLTPQTFRFYIYKHLYKTAKKSTLIKKAFNIETISKITYLCVDKIGLITQNKMSVKEFYSTIDDRDAILNCIMASDKNSEDTIDQAIWELAYESNVEFNEEYKLIKKYPFTSKSKMMAYVYEYNNELYIFVKGSLNSLFDICDLDVEEKYKLHNFQKQLYKKGLHVMAFGSKKIDKIEKDIFKYNINFNGILGISNIYKNNVKESIEKCKQCGIKIIMMTNDNTEISSSIGKQIGINNHKNILTGKELEDMNNNELLNKIKSIGIVSRVSTKNKSRIINALKNNNEIVAVTSDAIDDLEVLKNADIRIATTETGTDASKKNSDLIILNNNFETIVNTIKDARIICQNIKKLIRYIFVINIIFILLSLILTLFNYQILLLPMGIVILKLITEIICFVRLQKN